MELSEPVRGIIDRFKVTFADTVISEDDAKRLFLGESAMTVSDMNDKQLLQLCLCHSADLINQLRDTIDSLSAHLAKQPNRQARRRGGR